MYAVAITIANAFFASPGPDMNENLTAPRLFLSTLIFALISLLREIFYMATFPSHIVSIYKSQGHPKVPLLEWFGTFPPS